MQFSYNLFIKGALKTLSANSTVCASKNIKTCNSSHGHLLQVKVVSEPERIDVFLTRSCVQVTDISCGVVYKATLASLVLFRSYRQVVCCSYFKSNDLIFTLNNSKSDSFFARVSFFMAIQFKDFAKKFKISFEIVNTVQLCNRVGFPKKWSS